jgi:hypothetical protein
MDSGIPPHVAGTFPSPLPPPPAAPYSPGSPGRQWLRAQRPVLVLIGLAILIPELLTGSTPVASLVDPLGDLFLLGLYGGGVLVIREVTLRWNRGWAPVLLLGAAYGVVEEGLGTKTFFDWVEIGRPDYGPYTHWLGVNWVWVGELTVFHAIFSIALPIALVGLLFPTTRGQRFLSDRGVGWTFGAYLVTSVLIFFLYDRPFVIAPSGVIGCLVAIAALVLAAWKVPAEWLRPRTPLPSISPRTAFILGVVFVWGFFFVFWVVPGLVRDPFLTVAIGWAFTAGCLLSLRARVGTAGNDRQVAYLSMGLLTFLVCLAGVLEFLGDIFVFLAVAVTVWLLVRLYRQYRPIRAPSHSQSGVPAG